nr:hypothetical protein CFP56_03149 [Quercus suber]
MKTANDLVQCRLSSLLYRLAVLHLYIHSTFTSGLLGINSKGYDELSAPAFRFRGIVSNENVKWMRSISRLLLLQDRVTSGDRDRE